MGESGALEVVDRGRVDPVVLAKHEAAQELGLRVRGSAPQGELGAVADAIRHRRGPTPAPAGELEPVGDEDLADAVARPVAGLPGLGLAKRAGGLHLPADRKVSNRLGSLEPEAPVVGLDPHPHLAPRSARDRGHESARRRRPPDRPVESAPVDRRQANRAHGQPDGRCDERKQRQPNRTGGAAVAGPRHDQAESGGQAEHQHRPGQAGTPNGNHR